MKKKIKNSTSRQLLITLVAMTISLSAINSQQLEEYTLRGITADQEGLVAEINDTGIHLEVRVTNYTKSTAGFFIPCLGRMGSQYDCLRLAENGCLDIINKNNTPIYSIEYVGCSINQSESSNTLAGISLDGSTYAAVYKEKNRPNTNITTGMSFSGDIDSACRGYILQVPDTAYIGLGGQAEEHLGLRRQVHTVRLTWTKDVFGGKTNTTLGSAPELYGIKIKVVKQSSVDLKENTANSTVSLIRASEGRYQMSEPCRTEVYTLSGVKIKEQADTKEIDISSYPRGLYVVRIYALTGKAPHTQKVYR